MFHSLLCLLVVLGGGTFCAASAAEPPARDAAAGESQVQELRYLRISKTEQGKSKGLDTAIVRFVGPEGTPYAGHTVDLIGVVHVGQEEYYQALRERLATYDVVLYELVAPDGTRIRPEDLEARRGMLASMQTGLKDMLNLEYQLEKIDYMADNFRHADMSPEEFMQDMEERGDSIVKMVARMMGAGLATQSARGGDAGILLALLSNDRAMKMKQAMARQLTDIDAVTAGMDDLQGDNTLIKGRNAKAMEILKEELQAGKRRVAIFYGAGHLPDMAERLEQQFQMRPAKTEWLQAWDLQRN